MVYINYMLFFQFLIIFKDYHHWSLSAPYIIVKWLELSRLKLQPSKFFSVCLNNAYNAYFETFAIATAKNTVILPNFLLWKCCVKAQFPHSFGLIFNQEIRWVYGILRSERNWDDTNKKISRWLIGDLYTRHFEQILEI